MANVDKQNYCNQESVSEKSTTSIVNLLVRLGFKKKDYSYEGRKALWNKYAEEIKKDDKSGKLSTEYKGSARQNVAFIRFIENKIVREKSIIDPKTGDFKKVDVLKEGEKCKASVGRSKVEKSSRDLVHKKDERKSEKSGPKAKVEPKKEEPKPQPKVEPKKEEPKPEPKKEETKPQPKKEEPKAEPKKEETKPQPKVEPKKEESKPQPKVEPKKEEPKPQPKVEPKKEEPKPQPKLEPKKEEPKPQPKAEPKKEEPKPQPKSEPKKEEPKNGGDVPSQVATDTPVTPTDEPLSREESTVKGGGTEGKRAEGTENDDEDKKPLNQVEKQYDDEERFVKAQLDKWTKDNEGSPFDTGPGGSDGTQRGRYKSRGDAVILDNISGKKLKVNKDPSKADKIKDYVTGEEKPLTGEPLVCIDAAQRAEAELFGAKVPKGNRSVAAFEGYAAGRKKDFEVYNVNKLYSNVGEMPELPIACKPGDMITLGYTNSKGRLEAGRHIVVVTRVDKNGMPMECLNSAAITGGVGKRPFFEDKNTPDMHDYDGDYRSHAAVYTSVMIKKIIRPKAVHEQYVAYKKDQQSKELAQSN